MGKAEFQLGILYTTIAIMQPGEEFNDWNNTHVSQGFSWRPTSISFGTLSDRPLCNVVVQTTDDFVVKDSAVRVISVPFRVGKGGVEIASIADSKLIGIPEGEYELIFSVYIASNDSELETYEFTFIRNENSTPRILKADEQLSPPEQLLMEAHPAR